MSIVSKFWAKCSSFFSGHDVTSSVGDRLAAQDYDDDADEIAVRPSTISPRLYEKLRKFHVFDDDTAENDDCSVETSSPFDCAKAGQFDNIAEDDTLISENEHLQADHNQSSNVCDANNGSFHPQRDLSQLPKMYHRKPKPQRMTIVPPTVITNVGLMGCQPEYSDVDHQISGQLSKKALDGKSDRLRLIDDSSNHSMIISAGTTFVESEYNPSIMPSTSQYTNFEVPSLEDDDLSQPPRELSDEVDRSPPESEITLHSSIGNSNFVSRLGFSQSVRQCGTEVQGDVSATANYAETLRTSSHNVAPKHPSTSVAEIANERADAVTPFSRTACRPEECKDRQSKLPMRPKYKKCGSRSPYYHPVSLFANYLMIDDDENSCISSEAGDDSNVDQFDSSMGIEDMSAERKSNFMSQVRGRVKLPKIKVASTFFATIRSTLQRKKDPYRGLNDNDWTRYIVAEMDYTGDDGDFAFKCGDVFYLVDKPYWDQAKVRKFGSDRKHIIDWAYFRPLTVRELKETVQIPEMIDERQQILKTYSFHTIWYKSHFQEE